MKLLRALAIAAALIAAPCASFAQAVTQQAWTAFILGSSSVTPTGNEAIPCIAGGLTRQCSARAIANLATVVGSLPLSGGTMTGKLNTAAAAAAGAGFRLPTGTAPTSPNDGDMWVTSTGAFVQVNGGTVGPLTANAGGTLTNFSASGIVNFLTATVTNPTTTPSLAIAFTNQGQNTFLGGPCSGSATAPTVRAFCAGDFPSFIPQKNLLNIYTATQSTTPTALTSATTVNWSWGAPGGNIYTLLLLNNVTTLANPGGQVAGSCVLLKVIQPASGGPFTISGYGSFFKFAGGVKPVFSTAANAIDIINMCGTGTGEIDATFASTFSWLLLPANDNTLPTEKAA